jgi:hypothetical protein
LEKDWECLNDFWAPQCIVIYFRVHCGQIASPQSIQCLGQLISQCPRSVRWNHRDPRCRVWVRYGF